MSNAVIRSGMLAAMFVMAMTSFVASTNAGMIKQPKFEKGVLLLKLAPGGAGLAASAGGGLADLGVERIAPLRAATADAARAAGGPSPGEWVVATLARGKDTRRALAAAKADPRVAAAELNYEVRANVLPNDPRFGALWGLHNVGQDGGRADADIDAPQAWDQRTDGRSVRIAVIDTGIDYGHPDLAANVWTNAGEIAGNGVDDDRNGYVDDVHGYDFANGDGDPRDDHKHGTHVAGTIAAVGNNGVGVTGVAWRAELVAVKFLGRNGRGWTDDAVRAVDYAIAVGARILNNSWGGYEYSEALRDAIADGEAHGALFVAAAGNDANDNDGAYQHYPSSYDLPSIVAVAATDRRDHLAGFSNRGRRSVDLGAPGVDILSTLPNGRYGKLSGTSMATPFVSGAAALLWAQEPALTMLELKDVLLATTDPDQSLADRVVSGGRLNLGRALAAFAGPTPIVSVTPPTHTASPPRPPTPPRTPTPTRTVTPTRTPARRP